MSEIGKKTVTKTQAENFISDLSKKRKRSFFHQEINLETESKNAALRNSIYKTETETFDKNEILKRKLL